MINKILQIKYIIVALSVCLIISRFGLLYQTAVLFRQYVSLIMSDVMVAAVQTSFQLIDPFFTTKFMGRGMGLPTVLGAVQTHRGALRVISEPGKGTCIRVYLPPATAMPSGPAVPATGAARAKHQRTILIAEDDGVLRECIRAMLEAMGYRDVLEAENGAEALHLYQEHAERVGLVVLDLDMPVMDGAEAFTHLRKLNPALNILFSTGAWDRDPRLTTRVAQGPTGILHKPYRMEQLKAALATFG